jgi:sec-independent protein translocase protein TatB
VELLGIGLPELLMVLLVALLVLGPQRLPQVAVQLARAVRAVRRYAAGLNADLRQEFREALAELEEMRAEVQELRRTLDEQASQTRRYLEETARELEGTPYRPTIVETTAEPAPEDRPRH